MSHRIARPCGCLEYSQLSRRGFLGTSGAALAAAAIPAWLPKVVLAGDATSRDSLVVVFLRGGMDGLTAVAPYGDPNYYAPDLRPALAIAPPGSANGAIDLNGFFGFAPALAPLLPAYQAGDLAVIHATGSPDPTRSHFDAMSYMEFGIPLQPLNTVSGWLARHLLSVPPLAANNPLRGVMVDDLLPRSLAGAPNTLPIADPAGFSFPGRSISAQIRAGVIDADYLDATQPLASAAMNTIDTIDLLQTIDFANYLPANGAVYPTSGFGMALKSIAALLKADVGVEVAEADLGGWDTHAQQGPLTGELAGLMTDLAGSLAAFHLDMQARLGNVTLVVMSEFGRRADQNSSLGTDHGHGNCMFVLGGNVAGGRVIADWTSGELLHPDLLYGGDSLAVTIDYRDILAEILQTRLQNNALDVVFPNYTPTFRGVIG